MQENNKVRPSNHREQFVYRICFGREGSLSYIGHLDLMRTFERSFRRCGWPLLHSQGFNPRPMIVFALPLAVGISSNCDYLEVTLSQAIDIEEMVHKTASFLPKGLFLLEGWRVEHPKISIMALVTAATYQLHGEDIASYVDALNQETELVVDKRSKGKDIEVDIKSLIIHVRKEKKDQISLLVLAGSHQNLRPDLFLQALVKYTNYSESLALNCNIIRTHLWSGNFPHLTSLDIE